MPAKQPVNAVGYTSPENRDYFKVPANVQRVQAWRATHPGYSHQAHSVDSALQDHLSIQVIENNKQSDTLAQDALQDLFSVQPLVLIGLIAHLTHSALQEDIAQTGRHLLRLGQDIVYPNLNHKGEYDAKHLLVPSRLRQIHRQFSWIDQRLVRDHYIERCDPQALALYLFLVTVADAQGLSYYANHSIERLLSFTPERLAAAREALIRAELIAYDAPLVQVLALDAAQRPQPAHCDPTTPDPDRGARLRCGGNLMIDYSTYCKIHDYHKQQGLHVSQIAQALALNPQTVAHWLTVSRYQPRKTTVRSSKLDPYKPLIQKWLERHHYSGQQIFQRLREQGFDGGSPIVRSYVSKVRPRRPAAFLTLHFAPGETAQVDWGSYGSVAVGETRRKLSFFVMVLCYSRMLYVEFTCSQTMEQFLACHQHAFAFFGNRVPKNIMVDNLKSAVLKRLTGQAPVFNPKYLDFAQHHRFTIKACDVHKGNETAPAHPAPAALVRPCTSKVG